jgi:urea transport system permease protein
MRRVVLALTLWLGSLLPLPAQEFQTLLQTNADEIVKPSRGSVAGVLDDLVASGLPQVPGFLERWSDKGSGRTTQPAVSISPQRLAAI